MPEAKKPLKTFDDARSWLEKSINEIDNSKDSIARGNARISGVKAFLSLFNLGITYAKIVKGGMTIPEVEKLVKVEKTRLPAPAELSEKK